MTKKNRIHAEVGNRDWEVGNSVFKSPITNNIAYIFKKYMGIMGKFVKIMILAVQVDGMGKGGTISSKWLVVSS